MTRRSRRSGKQAKVRRRKAELPKRSSASALRHRSSSTGGQKREFARLRRERDEALERETATSAVLSVISSSPDNIQPVLEIIGERAEKLCDAEVSVTSIVDGGLIRLASVHGVTEAGVEAVRHAFPTRLTDETVTARAIRTRRICHVADVLSDPLFQPKEAAREAARIGGYRGCLGVPMIRDKQVFGSIFVARKQPGLFSDAQVRLLKTFADQAVIAIDNARLLNELRQRTDDLTESLEQQTATSEVLQVISSSPGKLEPVFQSMLVKAVQICEAKFGVLFRCDNDAEFHAAAWIGVPPAYEESLRQRRSFRPDTDAPLGRLLRTKDLVHTADELAEQSSSPAAKLGNARSLIAVPMRRENELIGAFVIYRIEVRPFTNKQVELVQNFAAQAVIAIENTRLLNELRKSTSDLSEALERQTATSDVLKIISSSPGDPQPVFNAILENATRICAAKFGILHLREGDAFRTSATFNLPLAFGETRKRGDLLRPTPASALGRLILLGSRINSKTVIHLPDVTADQAYIDRDPFVVTAVELGGFRSALAVPMLKDGNLIGAIFIFRQEVGAFDEKQIELLQNFAAQAVIAIENARLLDDLNNLNHQLEQRVTDQVSEIERMGRLRRFLPPQVADLIVASGAEKQLESHRREITALFCDLRGFTGFSESSDPEDVMALLREYHTAIGGIINKYGGTLERYAGDGVMVVFNDPIPVDNPALHAVLMAIDMRAALGELIEKWRKLGHDIGFGIGIAHGFATLGTIGFEGRFDYAAIGTVSNVASRLCDEAKPGQILISPRVLMAIEKDITVEPVGDFALKGIRRPLTAYNVLEAKVAS
jgi:GAF domain-containing protein